MQALPGKEPEPQTCLPLWSLLGCFAALLILPLDIALSLDAGFLGGYGYGYLKFFNQLERLWGADVANKMWGILSGKLKRR